MKSVISNWLQERYHRTHSSRLAVMLITPALLVIGLVILYPLLNAVWLSFLNYRLLHPDDYYFTLFGNYLALFQDEFFWIALKVTLVFTFSTVVIGLFIGLIMALALDQLTIRISGLRGLILVSWVVPGIVVGYIFRYMFDVEVGILNYFLQQIGIIESYLPWLMEGNLAMIAIIVAHVWNQAPFYMLMFTAGLKAIPHGAKEAAYVDGASRWQEFRLVTFPYLKGILLITSLLMVIRNFNNFPIIYTMTGGGPVYSTTTSVLYIYRVAFERYNMGYASAIGVVWVLVLLLVSILYVRALQKDF